MEDSFVALVNDTLMTSQAGRGAECASTDTTGKLWREQKILIISFCLQIKVYFPILLFTKRQRLTALVHFSLITIVPSLPCNQIINIIRHTLPCSIFT